MIPSSRPRRALRGRSVASLVALAVAAALLSTVPAVAERSTASGREQTTTTAVPGSTASDSGGQVAYVTPTGDVMVAEADGSSPVKIGHDAATNRRGLAPLSWRQPGADAVTYVRTDGALVVAPTDGAPETVFATDAVVPPDAEEDILSWDITGSLLIYLAQSSPGRVESRVVDLTTADDTHPPQIRPIGNPERRTVLAQAFSPIDPIIYQRTADPDTGREFTVAIVEPFKGTIFGSKFSLDDVTFSPDGRYVFAVSKGNGDVQQLVRVSMRKPTGADLVSDHDRVCKPSVSPDAKLIVFAAGSRCQEVWTIKSNGTDPKRIAKSVGGTAVFDIGDFSWSSDGRTITHAACKSTAGTTTCGGGYWDISVDGRTVKPRSVAGSVLRAQRPLLRPVKVSADITGPIVYHGRVQAGEQSVADPLKPSDQEVIHIKVVDQNDNARSYDLKLIHPVNSVWVSGTLRIVDSGFDEVFPFFGRLLPYSLGYAKLRGIWTRTQKMPVQSGQLTMTVER
ncbi:MAG: hypothetical protein U0Q22_16780 [Acidimicrobiales bacterium]